LTLTEKLLRARAGETVRFASRWNVLNDENFEKVCAAAPLDADDE